MAGTALLSTQIPTRFKSPTSITHSSWPPQSSSSSVLKTVSSRRRISLVRASSEPPQRPAGFVVSQEELRYLVKLGAGSVAGAAAIKYGTILYPQITLPNLPLALLIIFAPVLVAVLILIKLSSVD